VVAVVLVVAANRAPLAVVAGALLSAPPFWGAAYAVQINEHALIATAWLAVIFFCNRLAVGRTEATVQNLNATFAYRAKARRAVRRRVVVMNTGGIR
jgi:hypothetical protein